MGREFTRRLFGCAPSAGLRPKTLERPLGAQQLPLRRDGWSGDHNVLAEEVPRASPDLFEPLH